MRTLTSDPRRTVIVVSLFVAAGLFSWNFARINRTEGQLVHTQGQLVRTQGQLKTTVKQLAVVQKREQVDRVMAVRANLRARKDDCQSSNETRRQLRVGAKQGLQGLLLVRTLFPQIPETLVSQARAQYNKQLKAYAHRDCVAYSLQAAPK